MRFCSLASHKKFGKPSDFYFNDQAEFLGSFWQRPPAGMPSLNPSVPQSARPFGSMILPPCWPLTWPRWSTSCSARNSGRRGRRRHFCTHIWWQESPGCWAVAVFLLDFLPNLSEVVLACFGLVSCVSLSRLG